MSKTIVVPFGPQHPVLPEPVHLDLIMEDEKVKQAIPNIGYIHRGLETLVEKKEYPEYVYIVERICGICSFIHSSTYCQGIESLMNVEVPERADFLRTIWSEYSRLHSHLLWLGLAADALGFENLFMDAWRLRESVLDELESTTGGRVIQGSCKVGGVRRDIESEKLDQMVGNLEGMRAELSDMMDVFINDSSVKGRMKNVGILPPKEAYEYGAVGPTLRGSNVTSDARMLGYGAYGKLHFKPVVETGCDSYARCAVRVKELFTSMDLIKEAVQMIPDGPIEVKVTGKPEGECFTRAEQPRGEVVHYIKGNGTRYLARHRARTPTLANIPPLVKMLEGCELADVPVIVLSIDPCVGCMER